MVRLFVGGLPADVSDTDLRARFAPFGKVISVDIIPQKTLSVDPTPSSQADTSSPQLCRGFAYIEVEFKDKGSSAKCISSYNGCKWRGHVLRVEQAKEHYLLKLQREWDQIKMAEEAGSSQDPGVPCVLKADELNTQLGQLRLVHSRHRSKIVQIELGDRSKVRTIFPPPKPLPLASLSWDPIDNQNSFLYRQQAADEAARKLAARRKRAAEAAAAAAAEREDATEATACGMDGTASGPTSRSAAATPAPAAAPKPKSSGVVCFDSDQEAGPAAGADMDLDRFGSGSEDEGTRPQAGKPAVGERAKQRAALPVGLPDLPPPVLPLVRQKTKKAGRKRANSEHDLILQRQAMKALKRLGRLGKDMDTDEVPAAGGERVLSMAVSQSSSSSSERGGHSSSGNLPDDDTSEQDEDQTQEPESSSHLRSLSGHGASTSAHYPPVLRKQGAAHTGHKGSVGNENSSPDPPARVLPPSHARKSVMLAATGSLSDPEPGARQSSAVERRAAKAAQQLKKGGPKLKAKQKVVNKGTPGSDSRPYDADSSGEDIATPARPSGSGLQDVLPSGAAWKATREGVVDAGPEPSRLHQPQTMAAERPSSTPPAAALFPSATTPIPQDIQMDTATGSGFPDDDTLMTQQEAVVQPPSYPEGPSGLGWEVPATGTLAALDLATLLGDAGIDGTALTGAGLGWLGSPLTSPPLVARRHGRSRSGSSAGRESRESLLPTLQLGQQFMRSGSEEELRSSWQAQRDGLAADYKRKRRAALKASMNTSHKTQRRK